MTIAAAAALVPATGPLAAQDLGNVNPAEWSRYDPVHAAARAQARRQARPDRTDRDASRSTAQTCREVPSYARQLGNNDPRVRKLRILCRQAGYR